MNYADYKLILSARRNRVLTLTLNRPSNLNAVDGPLHEELSRIFYDVAIDDDADVIVLTGAGRAFSAGGDFGWFQQMIDDPVLWERCRVEAKKIVFGLLDCEKPVIAKLNGHAVGLGATLALFCDVIFAAKGARIADPHVLAGMVGGDGGAIIWPQLVGYARAKEYLMTGDPILPGTRSAWGSSTMPSTLPISMPRSTPSPTVSQPALCRRSAIRRPASTSGCASLPTRSSMQALPTRR